MRYTNYKLVHNILANTGVVRDELLSHTDNSECISSRYSVNTNPVPSMREQRKEIINRKSERGREREITSEQFISDSRGIGHPLTTRCYYDN